MVGCQRMPGVVAGSQPGHTFPEPDGHNGSPKDTKAAPFEFRRPLWEPEGQLRTISISVADHLITKQLLCQLTYAGILTEG
jgi:hypothetical protein